MFLSVPIPDPLLDGPIETERLIVRPGRKKDAEAYAQAAVDADLPWIRPADREGGVPSSRLIVAIRAQIEDGNMFSITDKAGRLLGSISAYRRSGGATEIGWLLRKDSIGHGYAREAAEVVIGRVFEAGRAKVMVVIPVTAGAASRACAETLGMKDSGPETMFRQTERGSLMEEAIKFEITAEEWAARKTAAVPTP